MKTQSQLLSPLWKNSLQYFSMQDENCPDDNSDLSHQVVSRLLKKEKKRRKTTYKLSILPATGFPSIQISAKEQLYSLMCTTILTTRPHIQSCAHSKILQRKAVLFGMGCCGYQCILLLNYLRCGLNSRKKGHWEISESLRMQLPSVIIFKDVIFKSIS